MKFTIEIFWVTPKGAIEPLFPIPLPPLELGSSAHARDVATKLVGHQDIPAHALTLSRKMGLYQSGGFGWMGYGGAKMPKGPNGQRRPGDVIGAAIMVAKIERLTPAANCGTMMASSSGARVSSTPERCR